MWPLVGDVAAGVRVHAGGAHRASSGWAQTVGVCLLEGSGVAFAGSRMLASLPSEGVYEDIGAVPMGDKDEEPRASQNLALEEDYDDAGEPELGLEEEGEEEEEEETPLSPAGVHLCALASVALFILYCSCARGSSLASAYI